MNDGCRDVGGEDVKSSLGAEEALVPSPQILDGAETLIPRNRAGMLTSGDGAQNACAYPGRQGLAPI